MFNAFLQSDMIAVIVETVTLWQIIGLFLLGMVAFIVSTISGGGGALLLIPITSAMLGASATAPVVNLGTFIGRPMRLFLFWQDIEWSYVRYYAPSAIIGAWIAGFLFSQLEGSWIHLLVGLFLISTLFQYRFGKVSKSFNMPKIGFAPLGFLVAIIGTLVGGLGPVLNPFYMNAGLQKEDLVATKTANSFLVGIAQISSYTFFGVLTVQLWVYGLALGAGALIGNYLGKHFLSGMSVRQFRRVLIILMVVSGVMMVVSSLREIL